MRAIETTEVQRQLAVEQAEVAKQIALVATVREQETAEILKKQAVAVAEREKEVAVAQKERERAIAQAHMLEAETERERATQEVVTVKVTAEAEREAAKRLISAKQVINENQLREQTIADVQAYTKVKDAEGERQAADLQYEATLRLAEGDAQSAIRRADGERAIKMVDVNVSREQVNVEQAKVEVERQSLSNKQEFEGAALKFELDKLRIQAEQVVRVAAAQAMGNMMAKAQMQIFGDPGTMARMSNQFMQAAGVGASLDGFLSNLPPEAADLIKQLSGKLGIDGTSHAAAPVTATTNGEA
jgi:hypothetical protein